MNGYEGTFEMVDPRVVVIDRRYQRNEKNTLIQQIAQAPRWEAFGVPTCFKRSNGMLYAADGQQRIAGVLASSNPPRLIPVVWFPLGTVEDEAAIFVMINEWRKSLQPIEKHKGKVLAKDPAALAIERALETAGFTFGMGDQDHHPRTISAVAGVGVIYNRIGEEGLVQTLTVIKDAWPDDSTGLATHILRGVGELVEEMGEQYDRGKLTTHLKRTTPAAILRKADELRFDFGGSKLSNVRRAFKALAKI